MIILDTDHLTLLQWGGNEGAKISKRLADLGIRRPPTSIVSYEEQTRGWLGELAKSAQMSWEIEVYARLHNTLDFTARFRCSTSTRSRPPTFKDSVPPKFESAPWI